MEAILFFGLCTLIVSAMVAGVVDGLRKKTFLEHLSWVRKNPNDAAIACGVLSIVSLAWSGIFLATPEKNKFIEVVMAFSINLSMVAFLCGVALLVVSIFSVFVGFFVLEIKKVFNLN